MNEQQGIKPYVIGLDLEEPILSSGLLMPVVKSRRQQLSRQAGMRKLKITSKLPLKHYNPL